MFRTVVPWLLVAMYGNMATASALIGGVVNCTTGTLTSEDAIDVKGSFDYMLVNVSRAFQFLQVSMRVSPCPDQEELIGTRTLTNETLVGLTYPSLVLVTLQYNEASATHSYELTLNKFNVSESVATTSKCGDFLGFRMTGVGASACVLKERKDYTPVHVSKKIPKLEDRHSRDPLDELHRRASRAYVVVICFTLVTYCLYQMMNSCSCSSNRASAEGAQSTEEHEEQQHEQNYEHHDLIV